MPGRVLASAPRSAACLLLLLCFLPALCSAVLTIVGRVTDGTKIDGLPAVAYWTDTVTQRTLTFMGAADTAGTRWNTSVLLDVFTYSTSITTSYLSMLQFSNGVVGISFTDPNANGMFYKARRAGSSSWNTTVSAVTGRVVRYNSMAEVNGVPMIAYYDATSSAQDLRVVIAKDGNGYAWNTPIVVYAASADTGERVRVIRDCSVF